MQAIALSLQESSKGSGGASTVRPLRLRRVVLDPPFDVALHACPRLATTVQHMRCRPQLPLHRQTPRHRTLHQRPRHCQALQLPQWLERLQLRRPRAATGMTYSTFPRLRRPIPDNDCVSMYSDERDRIVVPSKDEGTHETVH